MLKIKSSMRLYFYGEPVDMRKSFNSLYGLIRTKVKVDPQEEVLFAFVNKRGNYAKFYYWDRTGFCILSKRLEKGTFSFLESGERELSEGTFRMLLDGIGRKRKKLK